MKKPRTPVMFPRMKVRGARNKRKMVRRKIVIRVRATPHIEKNGAVVFDASPLGTHFIETTYYQDGWGRTFREPR